MKWSPRNGWRIFAGEVGVIVIGVLIALGAQQAVEELDRAGNRTFTDAALDGDLADLVVNAAERLMIARSRYRSSSGPRAGTT